MDGRSTGSAKQNSHIEGICRPIGEASPMPIAAVAGVRHVVCYANPAFCGLVSRPKEELIGSAFCDVVAAGDEYRPLLDRVYRTGQAETHTGQEDSASHPFYRSYTMWPLIGADGLSVGIIVQILETASSYRQTAAMNQALLLGSLRQHELTETTEENVRETANRFRFLAESMPQKIFTAKPDGDLDYLNLQWMTFTGLSLEQIQHGGWTQLVHPDDLEENARRWRHSVNTGEPFQFVHRLRRADGVYRWHLTRIQAMRNEDGQISMWIGSSTDISEQKEMEEALILANDSLRRANSGLEQFAYSASHDLQEPIRNIAIYGEIINKRYSELLDAKGKESLGFVVGGAQRMGLLVKGLLDYTHVSRAPDENEAESDAATALAGALSNLSTSIRETDAQITHDILPKLRVQEVALQQLLQNLIDNSIKYRRDETAPRVHVTARREGPMWLLSVRDNGIGIAPEYQKKVFGIFKRLHTGPKYPGTGIGLAICQRIVERYGGRIWVEPEAGPGATFSFTLPALDER
jgi:PAS domain S-box-containing protein